MRKVLFLFLFGQLNDDDIEWMLKAGRKRAVQAGEVLIRQGLPVDAVFILLKGNLAVWLQPRKGPERELARLQAGEIVGEMSFVDVPPSATVKALTDSTVFALPKPALTASLMAAPGFAARFYRELEIYLSTMVRERHRALGGSGTEAETEKEDKADELDATSWIRYYLAGGAGRPNGEVGAGRVREAISTQEARGRGCL